MNVLIDYHHSDLAEAMHKLFEDRLGYTVYVPGGMDWFDAGYVPYGSHEVARQFLEGPLDGFHPRRYRRLTLLEFRALGDWAVICATMAEQQQGFARLAHEVGARYAVQVGNTNQYIDWSLDPLVLNSSEMAGGIRMHQEFDKDGAFAFSPFEGERNSVGSFMNIFPLLPQFSLFEEARALMPDWTFGVHGHHGADGFVKPTSAIAEKMHDYAFAWHDKTTGDGFGHVIHQWAAVGRPLVGTAAYYRGKLAEHLWDDGVTSINLDGRSIPEVVSILRDVAADGPRYEAMCRAIRARLDARVDYALEAARIADALTLVPA